VNVIHNNMGDHPSTLFLNEIKKSWPDEDKETHFFWSLFGDNLNEIKELKNRGIDYWILDVGYLTYNELRFREENISKPTNYDWNKIHIRLTKNSLHNDLTNISNDDTRFKKLLKDDIWYPTKIESYEEKEISDDALLLITPSGKVVYKYYGYTNQQEWLDETISKCQWNTKRKWEIRFKPRPHVDAGLYKNKTIYEHLKGTSGVVTDISMTAIDSIVSGYPAFVHKDHVCSSIAETDYKNINNMKAPNKKDLKEWMCKVANCQFTLEEFKSGEIYEYIK
jgi:hypothetical protein